MWYATITACLIIFGFLSASPLFAQIRINEFSSAGSDDWIELYNETEREVDLSGFILRDNTERNKKELEGKIGSKEFLVIEWNSLNHDMDSVILMDSDGNKEEIIYGTGTLSAPLAGQSIGRKADGDENIVVFASSSKGSSNNDTSVFQTPTPTPSNTPTPTKTPTPDKEPTATEVPTPTKTLSPVKKLSITAKSEKRSASDSSILGRSESSEISKVAGDEKNEHESDVNVLGSSDNNTSGMISIGGSVLLLSACGILLWRKYKHVISP